MRIIGVMLDYSKEKKYQLLVECVLRVYLHRVSSIHCQGGTPARHVYETGELHAEPPRPAYKEGRHVHLRNVDGRHIEGIGSPCMPVSLQGMPTHLQGPAHHRPPLQRSKRLNRRLD